MRVNKRAKWSMVQAECRDMGICRPCQVYDHIEDSGINPTDNGVGSGWGLSPELIDLVGAFKRLLYL